jgi:hypothetical protein
LVRELVQVSVLGSVLAWGREWGVLKGCLWVGC